MTDCLSRYATEGEARVAHRLVDELLDRGYSVAVHDGCEVALPRSRDSAEIVGALCTTGEDNLIVFDADNHRLGTFQLIYGNAHDGSELIADWVIAEAGHPLFEEIANAATGETV